MVDLKYVKLVKNSSEDVKLALQREDELWEEHKNCFGKQECNYFKDFIFETKCNIEWLDWLRSTLRKEVMGELIK